MKLNFYFAPAIIMLCMISLTHACNNDTLCTDCRMIPLGFGPGGMYVTFVCYECVDNRQLNSQNQCICSKGFYQNGAKNCARCPQTCKKCISAQNCQQCKYGTFRDLNQGQCICIEGYQQIEGSSVCAQSPNILMIALSSVGSILCLAFSTVICICLRMRRGGHEVHDNSKKKQSNNVEVQIYEGYQSSYPMDNNSNLFWNNKTLEYKCQQLCSICLQSKPFFVTQCGHYFHPNCIYGWAEKKTTCPNCNQQISSKQIRRWCQKCLKVLMPVIRNVVIKRIGKNGKKKKQLVQSTPVQIQYCEECDGITEQESNSGKHSIECK